MKIIESLLTNNPCYTAGRKIAVKGLMLHSVGCPQPSAAVFVRDWNKASYDRACVHAFIDANTGDVYQTLPWNHRGWHCASGKKGSGNNTHIGVEMCEPACIKYTSGATFTCSDPTAAKAAVARTYNAAVELFAMLCKQFGLDPLKDGVIVSHKEGCARGIASNHGDPEHLWNQLGTGYTMNGFGAAVKAAMRAGGVTTPGTPAKPTTAPENEKEGKEMRYNKISEMPSYAQPTIIKMVDGGFIGGAGTARDENNHPADLDLSIDMIRVFVTNDRAGLYDKKP